ncbi:MAG: ExeA family protein, partial [Myxococcota bacterium]
HLNIAGLNKNIFEKNAITAIYQSSGGLLRRANNLARAALISAASGQQMMVSAEHVRLAETELI